MKSLIWFGLSLIFLGRAVNESILGKYDLSQCDQMLNNDPISWIYMASCIISAIMFVNSIEKEG